jgi:hypothetical protein
MDAGAALTCFSMRSHQGVGGGDPKPLPMKIRALLSNWQASMA